MRLRWTIAERSWNSPTIEVEAGVYIFAAALLLFLPLAWVAGAVLAAFIHELGHFAVLWLYDIRIWKIYIGISGARIETEPMPDFQELLCALAGPVMGACLCFLWRWVPYAAIWALVQTVFNLLPIYPLDGGRVVKTTVKLWKNRKHLEKSVANPLSSGYNNSN